MKRWVASASLVLLLAAAGIPVSAAETGKSAHPASVAPMNTDRNQDRIFDNLEQKLASAGSADLFDVIVQLDEKATDDSVRLLQRQAGDFAVKTKWSEALNGFSAQLNAGQIRALSKQAGVRSVELDLPVSMMLDTATLWTGVTQARSDFTVDGDGDGNPASYSTRDVVVAVIDTGIDAGHVDLDGGKVLAFRDEVNGRTAAYDDQGHGTHVSSIIAGTGEGNRAYKGVAPGAALVGVKVLNSQGSGTTTAIINGINWLIANKNTYNIRVGNMSLGSSGCSNGTDSLSTAVNNAVNAGITMMVAAGNSGPGKCTIGSPAAASGAVTVGAGVDPGEKGWGLAYFSSRGPTADGRLKPDIVTPGMNITAAKMGSTNGYVSYSGTSMATPFAAGVVALMLDANPSLTVSGVKSILYNGANLKDWGPTGHDVDYGRGMLIAYNAVRQAASGGGSFTDGLTHSYVSGNLAAKGQNYYWSFPVTDASKPIAVTMIMPNHTCSFFSCSPDFDLYLIGPTGTTVASATGTKRQEQINYLPTATGTYQVRVYSYSGTGSFFFDASYR